MKTYVLTNKLFNDVFRDWDRAFFNEDYSYWRREDTPIKSQELEESYEYSIPLPGFKKKDIEATIQDGEVYVLAKKEGENPISTSFYITEDANPATLSASHGDGLLTIKINKKENTKPKNIEIK